MKRKVGYFIHFLGMVSVFIIFFYVFQGDKQDGLLMNWFGSSKNVDYVFYTSAVLLITDVLYGFVFKDKENKTVSGDQE